MIVGGARFRDADFVPDMHRLAADLGIGDRTTFVPWLDDPRSLMRRSTYTAIARNEKTFCRSIIEAAATGVSTVAFEDGGAVDIIRNCEDGSLVAAGDTVGLGDTITKLVSDPVFRERPLGRLGFGSAGFAAPEHARRRYSPTKLWDEHAAWTPAVF